MICNVYCCATVWHHSMYFATLYYTSPTHDSWLRRFIVYGICLNKTVIEETVTVTGRRPSQNRTKTWCAIERPDKLQLMLLQCLLHSVHTQATFQIPLWPACSQLKWHNRSATVVRRGRPRKIGLECVMESWHPVSSSRLANSLCNTATNLRTSRVWWIVLPNKLAATVTPLAY